MDIRRTQEYIRSTISKKRVKISQYHLDLNCNPALVVWYMYYFSRGDFRGKLVGWCSGHVCVTPLLPPVSPGSHGRYAFEPGSCKSTFFFLLFFFRTSSACYNYSLASFSSECKAGEKCLAEPRISETEPR
ncbi:hypothetical protein GE21DRAFT_1229668 [Neurospora crassa]|nr:hypothetical protein B13N20.250 [imported] - Neurospora crassa [Neurospora crassa]KHE87161.1 hypothetical protein GE21DRAFT_1229668 [Neurospora crassa]